MVNLVASLRSMQPSFMKMIGIRLHTLQIEPGTVMTIWVPSSTVKKTKMPYNTTIITTKPSKPVVVLIHGFAGDGIFNWQLQVLSLAKKYSVYVPDLLFFGGSVTDNPDRTTSFQAEFVAKGLKKLGIEKCTVVGFSYGGMVAFKMAEMYPELVEAVVVTGAVFAITQCISREILADIGWRSWSEGLMPTTVKGCKALFKTGAHTKLLLPDRLFNDFIRAMIKNRKERSELLDDLIIPNKNTGTPFYPQKILLLWGENDQIFKKERALHMKQQLGEKTMFRGIKKAGHLVHIERPFVYNKCLKQFLASLHADQHIK